MKMISRKILCFFDLSAFDLGHTDTENPRVGGSIPPLGTINSFKFKYLQIYFSID